MLITFLQDVVCVISSFIVCRLTPKFLQRQTSYNNKTDNLTLCRKSLLCNPMIQEYSQGYSQPKIERNITFSPGRKNNILIKKSVPFFIEWRGEK